MLETSTQLERLVFLPLLSSLSSLPGRAIGHSLKTIAPSGVLAPSIPVRTLIFAQRLFLRFCYVVTFSIFSWLFYHQKDSRHLHSPLVLHAPARSAVT